MPSGLGSALLHLVTHNSHFPGLHACHYYRSQAHCMHWLRMYAVSHIIFPTFRGPLYAWVGPGPFWARPSWNCLGWISAAGISCLRRSRYTSFQFALYPYRHPHSDAQLISRSRVHVCLHALTECLSMCLDPTFVSAPFSTLVKTASPCSTSGIPYERALHSLHSVPDARSRPTAQLSSAQCTQLRTAQRSRLQPVSPDAIYSFSTYWTP